MTSPADAAIFVVIVTPHWMRHLQAMAEAGGQRITVMRCQEGTLLAEALREAEDRAHGPRVAPRLLTVPDVADALGISDRSVLRLAKDGALPIVTVGKGAKRVRVADLDAFVEHLPINVPSLSEEDSHAPLP